jgi:hypothetical protein
MSTLLKQVRSQQNSSVAGAACHPALLSARCIYAATMRLARPATIASLRVRRAYDTIARAARARAARRIRDPATAAI